MSHFLRNAVGPAVSVNAAVANRAHPSIEVEDVAEGVIMYKGNEGGEVPISFFVNTFHPYDAPICMEIIGEGGKVYINGDEAVIQYADGQIRRADTDSANVSQPEGKSYWGNSHVRQIDAFYKSIAGRMGPEIDGVEGLRTQRLINGIYDSAKSGKAVSL
jgi:predicted dehydrogenase